MNVKNVRIKDIAQLAGVSVGTVDRVLHNRGRVSEDALKKVLAVLDQIDYKPNLIARTLGSNKEYTIAALMPNPEQDPYWASSRSGINQAETEWTRYGVTVRPYFFNLYDKNSFEQVAQKVSRDKPDGILIAPIFYHETLPFFALWREQGVPYALFNTNIAESEPLSFIGQNLFQSGRLAGELMHISNRGQQGLFSVLHINEDLGNSVHLAEKERGFREYFNDQKISGFNIETLNLSNQAQATIEAQLLPLLNNPLLKGIFVSTSKATSIIASLLEKQNKTQINLVGYDMLEENVRFLKKRVVNFLINQNPKRQAFLGVKHLVNHLILHKPSPEVYLLPLEVISTENVDSYLSSHIH
jgi:LacI family transcriptional regulator